MKTVGIYVHIPFCVRKCAYCDFYSLGGISSEGYAAALKKHILSRSEILKDRICDTVYFGGGTPSLLPAEELQMILDTLRDVTELKEDAEISMESNPGTLTAENLYGYRKAGINRLSIGLQSADEKELKNLSRIHTLKEFENSFSLARKAGFRNINIDLMYGLPDQKEETLYRTVDYVLSKKPEHISFYGLKIEPNTPFGKNPETEKQLPDADRQADMYLESARRMENAGYRQYEISNFAKPGYECRHNRKYWKSEDFIGFGPAAYSMLGNTMFSVKKDLKLFLSHPEETELLCENVHKASEKELSTQYVMLAFRLTEGIDTEDYRSRFGKDFDETYLDRMKQYRDLGYIRKTENGYCLSKNGMLISNYILSDILDFDE